MSTRLNPTFAGIAYKARLTATLDGRTPPNRAEIRDRIRHSGDRALRAACFGIWRHAWADGRG